MARKIITALAWNDGQQKALRRVRRRAFRARRTRSRLSQRGANLLGDGLERGWIGTGDVRKHLAVHLDPSLAKAVNKLRVGKALGAGRSVDALDPQRAERALAHLAVAVGVLPGLVDRGLRRTNGVLAAAKEALGLFQHLLVPGVGDNAPFYTRHVSRSLLQAVGDVGADGLGVGRRHHLGAPVLADVLGAVAHQPVALARDAGLDQSGRSEFEALLGARLG